MRANDQPDLPVYRCHRSAAESDGQLHRNVWLSIDSAPLVDTTLSRAPLFRRSVCDQLLRTGAQPDDGWLEPSPRMPTSFAVCWTSTHLHILFRCIDTDIRATLTGHDEPLYEEEVVEAFICPSGDIRNYYEFETNPLGARFDARVFSPDLHRSTMTVETEWDCNDWTVDVQLDFEDDRLTGFRSEWAIPFSAFPEVSAPLAGDIWRANFFRIERSLPEEFTAWSPTGESPANFHVPERFGFIEFLD